jgi:hypothetical protein
MTQLLKQQSLQYPRLIKLITDRETKEYYLKKHYQLSLNSIGVISQLVEPTDEQKEWVLHRLKQPVEYWQRWIVSQYFTQEKKVTMGLTDKDVTVTGVE